MSLKELLVTSKVKMERVEDEDMKTHRTYLRSHGSSDKVVYSHRGIVFPEEQDLFWINLRSVHDLRKTYDFLYVFTPEKEEFLYYFPSRDDAIEPLGKVKQYFLYGIDVTERKYCFEIKVNVVGEMYINYITTEPKGCNLGLKGLFEILYLFLYKIGYKGKVALKDDVQIAGKFITYERILEGKPSIYEKYGFRILPERLDSIRKAKDSNDLKTLKVLCSNIPMVARDISKFV